MKRAAAVAATTVAPAATMAEATEDETWRGDGGKVEEGFKLTSSFRKASVLNLSLL